MCIFGSEQKFFLPISALLAERPVRIDIKMFWAPLLLLLLGVIVSILIFFVEVLYYKYKGRVSILHLDDE